MSLFGTFLRAQSDYPAAHPFWYGTAPTVSSFSGVPVSHETSLKIAAVWQGQRIINEGVAKVPLFMYRHRADGRGKDTARNHPLFDVLHTRPNDRQNSFQFRELMTGWAGLRGKAYAEIKDGPRGAVDQLWPINPDWVRPEELPDNRVRYRVTEPGKSPRIINQEDMFYLEGPYNGRSLVRAFAESVGLSVAASGLTASVYKNSARFPGALKLKRSVDDLSADGRKNLRESFHDTHGGWWNAGNTPILEDDMDWVTTGMTLEDASVITSRDFEVIEFARWLNIPPHRLMIKNTQPRANMEQEAREFVQETLMPWLARWEGAISRDLILRPDVFFAEFMVEGLLRGDMAAQAAYFHIMIQDGLMNKDEVRSKLNMNPIPGGNVYMQPMNMAPSAARHHKMIQRAANALVTKEVQAMRRAYTHYVLERDDYAGFVAKMDAFYARLVDDVSDKLVVSRLRAGEFVKAHVSALRVRADAERINEIVSVLNLLAEWEKQTAAELVNLAMEDLAHDTDGTRLQPHTERDIFDTLGDTA
jgi:HK97 family phage portal protein